MDDQYRQYFEEMPDCVHVQDPDLRILDANRRFRELFGDGAGMACYEATRGRTEKCPNCIVERTFQEGRSCQCEDVVTTREGHERPVLLTTQPLCDEQGRISAVMVTTRDINDPHQAQGPFVSLGFLVGSISHGIKGQLTGVDGGVYLMNSGYAKDNQERVQKGWAMVQRNVDRIRAMVQDVLYYAKDRIPQLETIQVGELLQDFEAKVKKKLEGPGLEFSCRVAVDDGEFTADPNAVRALLANILEQSLESCRIDAEKETHQISLHASEDAERIIFTIEDNGAGMKPETREIVLSPLLKARGLDGPGPGLFIANKIAASHGGTMEIDSSSETGTRFVVKIPKKGPEPEDS